MDDNTTWKKLLEYAKENAKDDSKIVKCTLPEEDMNKEFNGGFGGEEGRPFTAWSENRVYFPLCYDGSEWVGSAPRNPCDEACMHQGGG